VRRLAHAGTIATIGVERRRSPSPRTRRYSPPSGWNRSDSSSMASAANLIPLPLVATAAA